ncbi:glycoside hydrolase family 32 protein [Fundicoccus culcitae]|uniref:beta-fructofuranosidase n=1 Tax=Fundicoccus culcitae TaxID=2969821 RepID=A0ABY5P4M1_9LACT|nr:glycoside hydrolase family 32 protein [Fundicoccus culcitae]UUX33526.1 glycoside hydrolase family 32 protein [Fundicoccus culcitae]
MKYTLEKSNEFIKQNLINKQFYPVLNYSAPIGWINDPNGVSIYNNQYHLFYQYYPYDSKWGPMHWGHSVSEDGINWEDQPVALAPDQWYDKDGCFSGSAIEKDGKLYLMYTGHLNNEDEESKRENQNIAISEDGIHFTKYENNPVLDESSIPAGTAVQDFRDPKMFEKDGVFYCLIGSRSLEGRGQVLLYRSDNLLEWVFVSVILEKSEYLGSMAECPDILFLDEKDVLVVSAMDYYHKDKEKNYPHCTLMLEGKFNWETFKFDIYSVREMDEGLDFYAPQSALDKDGTYFVIAWHQAWNRTYPTDVLKHSWTGQMTMPRQLYLEDGLIKQRFHPNIVGKLDKLYEVDEILVEDLNFDEYRQLQFLSFETEVPLSLEFSSINKISKVTLEITNQKLNFTRKESDILIYDSESNDINKVGMSIYNGQARHHVEIILDRSSIQVIIDNYYAMSNTFYLDEPIDKINLVTDNIKNKINNLLIGTFIK